MVFDLGGVLIDWDPRHLYRQMFSDPEEMEVFLRDVVSPDWNAEQDSGRTWAEATALLLEQHPQHEPLISAYVDRWDEMLAGPFDGSVAILSEVRDLGLHIYALTNWSGETFPRARRLFPFLGWFEGIVVSGDEGIRKPDPEIWQRLISRYAIDPTTTVYIDDMPCNVEVAAGLGFHAIRFGSGSAPRHGRWRPGSSCGAAWPVPARCVMARTADAVIRIAAVHDAWER